MFRTRLLSGIVLVIIALVLVITGGGVLLAGLFAISMVGMYEFYRVFQIERTPLGAAGYLAATVYYVNLFIPFIPEDGFFVVGLLVLVMAVYVFQFPKYRADQVFASFAGVFYVAVMLSGIYLTRRMEAGAYIVWLIFLCSWGSDTCAYCVGVLIGKHKMAPKLSPKKSMEGAAGGVLGAVLLTALYGWVFRQELNLAVDDIFRLAGIGGIGAIVSMIGDLAASAIKRNYEIKDYGKLIPGHGGILDRFDSVIFTAPMVYYLAKLFL